MVEVEVQLDLEVSLGRTDDVPGAQLPQQLGARVHGGNHLADPDVAE
jgi:hypothetical protein